MSKKPTTPPTLRVVSNIDFSVLLDLEEPLCCLSDGVQNLLLLAMSDLIGDTEKGALLFLHSGLKDTLYHLQKAFDKATERPEPLPVQPGTLH